MVPWIVLPAPPCSGSPAEVQSVSRCLNLPDIDECASSPCRNGGTCTDEVNGYSCACTAAWTGPACNTGALRRERLAEEKSRHARGVRRSPGCQESRMPTSSLTPRLSLLAWSRRRRVRVSPLPKWWPVHPRQGPAFLRLPVSAGLLGQRVPAW